MLPKSLLYDQILADPTHYAEIMLVVGEVGGTRTTIPSANIMSLATHCSLYGEYINIGKCVINSFEAVLDGIAPTVIPRLSRVEVWCRLRAGNRTTNWLPKGVFHTRKPAYDAESNRLAISGLDMMHEGEGLPYPLGSTVSGWNLETTRTVAERMATFMGLTIEDTSVIPQYAFALPPFGYTAREILHDIATACCGNFMITYVNSGDETTPVATPKLRFVPIGTLNTPTDLGRNVQKYEIGDQIPVVGYVCINYGYDNDGATLSKTAGTENDGNKRNVEMTISTITDGDVIQSIATTLYQTLSYLSYKPCKVKGVPLDPACEVGDIMSCNNLNSPMGSIDTQFSKAMYASITAPDIPEEEDFPMFSAGREIQRNYETEASKIAGTVKFVDLSTVGATEINGSNIKSGTITLGGNGNGNGQMAILDENDVECGSWDNEGIIIFDNSSMINGSSANNKIKIIRQGDPKTTTYAVKIGTLANSLLPNERTPYAQFSGNAWDNVGQRYKARTTTIYDGVISMVTKRYTDPNDAGTDETMLLQAYPNGVSNLVSRTSGLTIYEQETFTWGRMAQITLTFKQNASYSAGSDIFVGTISDYLPKALVAGCGYYGSSSFIGTIDTSGNIRIRAIEAVSFSDSYTASISFTYLF